MSCSGPPLSDPTPPPEVPEGHGFSTVEGVGFQAPQSVLHDAVADLYLVSNLGPSSDEEGANGFISRLRPNGKVHELRWIDGAGPRSPLHAPRGMALKGDTLLVADGECIRSFMRADGTPTGAICLTGQGTLNDVTVDRHGVVYATGSAFTRDGSFAFSNTRDSTVVLVLARDGGSRGEVFTLARSVAEAGDLGYDPRRERILIPQGGLTRLVFVDLWPDLPPGR